MAPTCAAGAGASIELLAEAKVAGPTVLLGEVARLHSDDPELLRKLVGLSLGRAPQAGDLAVLQRDALAGWLRRQAVAQAAPIAWSGAEESKVVRRSAHVGGDDIAAAAAETLRSALSAQSRDARVQVATTPRDLEVPPGPVRLEVRGVERATLRNRAVLWVDVWAGERFVRAVPVSLEIARQAAMATAPSGEPNGPDEPGALEPPAVARGDWATLRSSDGVITVESRVEVLQDGRPGQKVRVRAHAATGPAFARVVGRGQLELVP